MQEAGDNALQRRSSAVCQHKLTFQSPVSVSFPLAPELPVTRLRSPYSFRFGVSPLVFCPLGLQLGPPPCRASSKCRPPAEVGILNFHGTSLGVRSMLLMPALMPLCGLALLGCKVPEKPIVPIWVWGRLFPFRKSPCHKKGHFSSAPLPH